MFGPKSKEPEKSIDLSSVSSELEKIGGNFMAACNKDLSWNWDDRFCMVLAEFDLPQKDLIYSHLKQISETVWDHQSVRKAPKPILQISKQLGGVNDNQLLFVSPSFQDAFIFCAWWPWGNGKRFSIRLSPFSPNLSNEQIDFLNHRFKTLFGL